MALIGRLIACEGWAPWANVVHCLALGSKVDLITFATEAPRPSQVYHELNGLKARSQVYGSVLMVAVALVDQAEEARVRRAENDALTARASARRAMALRPSGSYRDHWGPTPGGVPTRADPRDD